MLRKTPAVLVLLVAWGCGPGDALAQNATAEPGPSPAGNTPADPATPSAGAPPAGAATTLPPVVNTATRTDRRADEVPATVTTQSARQIEAAGARDIKDLFRNEVDLSVRAAPGRFSAAGGSTGRAGNEGINIRGLEGNQVLMLVDGIRVPGGFKIGRAHV